MLFKDSVRTSKRTQHFTITKINWLIPFKGIIAVYTENYMDPINVLCGENAELLCMQVVHIITARLQGLELL
jgi:hypothetical protein